MTACILNFWRIYIHPRCRPQGRQLNYESITITSSSLVGWTWISSFPSVTNLMTSCFRNTNHSVLYFRHLASCCTAITTRSNNECLLGATEYQLYGKFRSLIKPAYDWPHARNLEFRSAEYAVGLELDTFGVRLEFDVVIEMLIKGETWSMVVCCLTSTANRGTYVVPCSLNEKYVTVTNLRRKSLTISQRALWTLSLVPPELQKNGTISNRVRGVLLEGLARAAIIYKV